MIQLCIEFSKIFNLISIFASDDYGKKKSYNTQIVGYEKKWEKDSGCKHA